MSSGIKADKFTLYTSDGVYRFDTRKEMDDYREMLERNAMKGTRRSAKLDLPNTQSYHVGSSDYSKHKIQPWNIWLEYQLNPWDADMIKRILRTKEVEGMTEIEARILDYEKIRHICQERIDQLNDGDPYYNKENK